MSRDDGDGPRSSYDAFSHVDNLVSKPILGSDGAASWQEFRSGRTKHKHSAVAAAAAPHIPMKRLDKLSTGMETFVQEREHEEQLRKEAGDAPVGGGYTNFKHKINREELERQKQHKLILNRVRPDKTTYFIPSETFGGWKFDYIFTTRDRGTGYYWDGMDGRKQLLESLKKKNEEEVVVNDDGIVRKEEEVGRKKPRQEEEEKEDSSQTKNKKMKKRKTKKSENQTENNSDAVEEIVDGHDTATNEFNPMEQVEAALRRRAQTMQNPLSNLGSSSTTSNTIHSPNKWEESKDPQSGRTYYFCRQTGERQWHPPPKDGDAATLAGIILPSHTNTVTTVSQDDTLPLGWSSAKDIKTGKAYYYHSQSGKTSWNKPDS